MYKSQFVVTVVVVAAELQGSNKAPNEINVARWFYLAYTNIDTLKSEYISIIALV